MQAELKEQLGHMLAHNRLTGTVSELPLDQIELLEEAQDIQIAALASYSNDLDGFALVGTSKASQRLLNHPRPIYSEMPSKARHADGCLIRLPYGVVGAQCEFVFTIGQPFPGHQEEITRDSAANAIVTCQPAIGILGRRAARSSQGYFAAIADFGLHVATVVGSLAELSDFSELDAVQVTARINDNAVASASASEILGHPLEAIMWLAQELSRQGKVLNAGDIVATGSCTPILQILPGQLLSVDFGSLGKAACRFS